MPRKPKFKPRVTRVKLYPEQAVLSCDCYNKALKGVWHPLANHPQGATVVLACSLTVPRVNMTVMDKIIEPGPGPQWLAEPGAVSS